MPENVPQPVPSPGASARTDPMVGKRLASYEILSRVARGGMGVVYRARHVYIDRIVALKVLDPALAGRQDLIERFRTEAQSLARVEHENVIKVIDILEEQGVHFIVMDFAEGVNLRVLVKEKGPLAGGELLNVARQSADALYAAHKQGILHRDIKPENLILSARGRCKLTDFGLAGDLRLIAEGHEGPLNFGTPAYAAPEVLRRMTPDVRSDIFSWGATMYHLATGEPPFGATGSQQIQLRQKQGAELLESRRPDLPRSMCALIQDCMAFHPEERPENFREVLGRLPKRVHDSTAEIGAPTTGLLTTTAPTEASSPRDFTRLYAAVSALLALGAIIVLAVVIYSRMGDDAAPITPANVAVSNQPANGPRPRPPQEPPANVPGADGRPPAFTAEEDAYNLAELEARTALSASKYRRAYEAWTGFLNRFPEGALAARAHAARDGLVSKVGELREAALRAAEDTARRALEEGRTADALAAWLSVPAELLEHLYGGENEAMIERVETRKQAVITQESNDLAQLLESADKLRQADRLLDERALLIEFCPPRTEATQDKVNARLARLGQLLGARRQRALDHVAAQRKSLGEQRGEASRRALAGLESLLAEAANRRFEKAAQGIAILMSECGDSLVDKLIEDFGRDLALAAKAERAIADALERSRRRGGELEVKVHASMSDDGTRSGRLDAYSGKVTGIKGGEFTLAESGGGTRTIKIALLHFSAVRAMLKDGSADERGALIAWLFAQSKMVEARSELGRLLKAPGVTDAMATQLAAMDQGGSLGAAPLRWLRFLAARERLLEASAFVALYGDAALESRMLAAQAAVRRGEPSGAADYLSLVLEAAEREWVGPEVMAQAIALAPSATTALLKRWVDVESILGRSGLEPYNPEALVKLAQRMLDENQVAEARRLASLALALDASNETAWLILKR